MYSLGCHIDIEKTFQITCQNKRPYNTLYMYIYSEVSKAKKM